MDSETYGLSALLLAALTGMHIETAKRWKRHGRIPEPQRTIVRLRTRGDLGEITGSWKGFRLADGDLWTPEGARISTGEVRAIPYRREHLRELERKLAEPQQWKLF
jgi:hypothetical protein